MTDNSADETAADGGQASTADSSATPRTDGTGTTATSGPGFGVPLTALAALGAVGLLRYRS